MHPYSSSITQPGSAPHVPVIVRKCHMTYVGIMLTVQTMISSVDADVKNGNSQRRYQGKTAGAHKRVTAIGQAYAAGLNSCDVLRSQVAVASPTTTANPASNCGAQK